MMSSSDGSVGQLVLMKTGGGGLEVGCINLTAESSKKWIRVLNATR